MEEQQLTTGEIICTGIFIVGYFTCVFGTLYLGLSLIDNIHKEGYKQGYNDALKKN